MDNNQSYPWTLNALATGISTVPLAPYFTCVHYCLIALTLRNRPGAQEHARNHSFASLFVCVVSCFGGSIICNFLMNKSILHIFYVNSNNIAIIAFIWYNMNFSPLNLFYNLANSKPIKAALLVLKEVHRIRQITDGVLQVVSLYPNSTIQEIFFVAVVIGSIKGSGAKFLMRPLDHLIRGNIVADNEFLKLTFSTNHAIVSSILITLQRQGTIRTAFPDLLMYLVIFAAVIQLATLLFNTKDPYSIIKDWVSRGVLMAPARKESPASKEKKE